MPLRKLNPTDLANLAAIEDNKRVKRLDSYAKTRPYGWSYGPIRKCEEAIFGASAFPGLPLSRLTGRELENYLEGNCWDDHQQRACKEIAVLMESYSSEVEQAIINKFDPIYLGWHGYVSYWSNMVFLLNGTANLAFFDYRQNGGLSSGGRLITLSAMHHSIRMQNPDLLDAELSILQFKKVRGTRQLIQHKASELNEPLLSADELTHRFAMTIQQWKVAQEAA